MKLAPLSYVLLIGLKAIQGFTPSVTHPAFALPTSRIGGSRLSASSQTKVLTTTSLSSFGDVAPQDLTEASSSSELSVADESASRHLQTVKTLKKILESLTFNIQEVTLWRIAAAVCLTYLARNSATIDGLLVQLWHWLKTSPDLFPRMFRSDHWEWAFATVAFAVYIHGYLLADVAVNRAAKQGQVHPWRRFRLHDRYQLQRQQRKAQRMKAPDETVDETPAPAIIEQRPWHWKPLFLEMPLYMIPLYILDKIFPRRAAMIAPWGAPSLLQIVRDVLGTLLLFDTIFFSGHVLMHKASFFRKLHEKHHDIRECRAADSVHISFLEEALQVAYSLFSLSVLKCHPVSRSIYVLVMIFLFTESHSGFDFPWSPQNVVPFNLVNGSRQHHYHHRFGTNYYQKFFCHWDRLFGFVQKRDGSLKSETVHQLR